MELAKEIGLDIIVAQTAGLVAADMDGEKVMLNIESGKYFGLDRLGSRIWELIEKPHTVRALVATLLTEYDVEEKTCQNDIVAFVGTLHAKGLVDIE